MKPLRLSVRFMVCFAGLGLAGCGAEGDGRPGEREPGPVSSTPSSSAPDMSPGTIRGVVRDATTDRPIEGALVAVGDVGATSDAAGAFRIPPLPAGPTRLHAYQRGFIAESTTIVVAPGGTSVVDLPLRPSATPCCTLEGSWSARFALDSPGLNESPGVRGMTGRLMFVADSAAGDGPPPRVSKATGTSALEFGDILGPGFAAPVSASEGLVFHGDSVAITLLPRFGDWAIELRGREVADTVRGDWFQRASCCGAYGNFVLVRDAEN